MKKYSVFFLSAICSLMFLVNCTVDTGDIGLGFISIDVFSPDAVNDYDVGETVNVRVSFSADEGLRSMNYTFIVDGVSGTKVENSPGSLGIGSNDIVGSVDFQFEVEETLSGTSVTIVFEIVDNEGQTREERYEFRVNEFVPAAKFPNVVLEGPLFDNSSESFLSTADGITYTAQEVAGQPGLSADVDLGLHYGVGDGITFVSPLDYNSVSPWYNLGSTGLSWPTTHRTLFKLVSGATSQDFEDLNSVLDLRAFYDSGGSEFTTITDLQEGDVLAFLTDPDKSGGSKYGAIYIKTVTDGNVDGDLLDSGDQLLLDVTVEE